MIKPNGLLKAFISFWSWMAITLSAFFFVCAGGGQQNGSQTGYNRFFDCHSCVVDCGSGHQSGHFCKTAHDRNRQVRGLSSQLKKSKIQVFAARRETLPPFGRITL